MFACCWHDMSQRGACYMQAVGTPCERAQGKCMPAVHTGTAMATTGKYNVLPVIQMHTMKPDRKA